MEKILPNKKSALSRFGVVETTRERHRGVITPERTFCFARLLQRAVDDNTPEHIASAMVAK